jgi:phosphatidylinositol alpha-1,6-mannosyltransferase
MRILCCSPDYKPAAGGVAEYTYQVARALRDLGHDVIVVAPPAPGADAFDRDHPELPTTRLGGQARSLAHLSYRNLLPKALTAVSTVRALFDLKRSLAALVDAQRIDLVLCFHWDVFAPAAWLLRRARGVPYYVVCYGQEIQVDRGSLAARLQRRILRDAANVIAISGYARDRVRRQAPGAGEPIVSLCGVDTGWYQRMTPGGDSQVGAASAGKRLVLFIGRLVERKGIDRSIEAFALCLERLPDPRLEFWIAGDGPQRAQLEALVTAKGLQDRVRFLGPVSEDEKRALYSVSEVFITTSRELPGGDAEGFGIVFLEANACELPVVAGNSGGIPDAVAHGVSGLLVDPDDPAAIAAAMQTLLADRDLAERMGRAGRERAERDFSWRQVARRILSRV